VLIVVLVLLVITVVYHLAGTLGVILPAIAAVLFLLRGTAARARRNNPAPQPPTTHGRRR
jgi:hypothetical protein